MSDDSVTYKVLAHRPDSEDYCMGCVRNSYSCGDKEFMAATRQEVVEILADILEAEKKLDQGESGYVWCHIFQNVNEETGECIYLGDAMDTHNKPERLTDIMAEVQVILDKNRAIALRLMQAKVDRAKADTLSKEKAELKRLCRKLGIKGLL